MEHQLSQQKVLMGRLQRGEDLLDALTARCRAEGITLGRITALGAVEKARLGFYHQDRREYEFFEMDQPLEILSLVGNVSLKEGEVMIHAHLTLGDSSGRAFGGHLAPGTIVFACEYTIDAYDGEPLNRGTDQATGLPLWQPAD